MKGGEIMDNKVKIICPNCSKEYYISNSAFNARKRTAEKIFYCKSCTKRSLWANMSDEKRKLRSNAQIERWKKLTKSEKEIVMRKTRIASNAYNRSETARLQKVMANTVRWKSMTDDERSKEIERLNQIRKDCWKNMSIYEKHVKMEKMRSRIERKGPTEYEFSTILGNLGLFENKDYYSHYDSYPFIDAEFFNAFGKINAVTGEENSPFHIWDFMIDLDCGRGILIDIDGSSHRPGNMCFTRKGNLFTERDRIDYNDKQRPYQIPDGFDAYIIKAYYDNFKKDCSVINIKNNSEMTFHQFIEFIRNLIILKTLKKWPGLEDSSTISKESTT